MALVLFLAHAAALTHHPAPLSKSCAARVVPPRMVLGALSLESRVYLGLDKLDRAIGMPSIRVAAHAPALATLAYFGLVATGLDLGTMGPRALARTVRTVITRVGSLPTGAAASSAFATLVTPAHFVFVAWRLIWFVQLATIAFSLLRPAKSFKRQPVVWRIAGGPMTQTQLSALTLANGCAAYWLLAIGSTVKGRLPFTSTLALLLVPFFAGLPLRDSGSMSTPYRPAFELLSSFGMLAGFVAVAAELQYGGRLGLLTQLSVPFTEIKPLAKLAVPAALNPEAAASSFVALTAAAVSLANRCLVRRATTVFALTGILASRLAPAVAVGLAPPFVHLAKPGLKALQPMLGSPSFLATLACWGWAVQRLMASGFGRRKFIGGAKTTVRKPPPPQPAPTQKQDDRPKFGERGVFF